MTCITYRYRVNKVGHVLNNGELLGLIIEECIEAKKTVKINRV